MSPDPSRPDDLDEDPWALSAIVSEQFLNALARSGVGSGIEVEEVRQHFQLPMLGSVDVGVGMVIVEVSFSMDGAHADRLMATIRANGVVTFHGDSAMPAFPGVARVRGDVLVEPKVELGPDGRFLAVLDVAGSELVSMAFEGIEGIDTDADAQEMMGQMLFAAVGGELFGTLSHQLGTIGLELEPDQGSRMFELGVRPGRAHIRIDDGSMTVGLPAVDGLEGNAVVQPVSGAALGVGVAAGALTALANRLAAEAVGVPLPFELDVIARDDRVGARVRNRRLVDLPIFPDLRPGLRSTVEPRLVGERLELGLREAWVELPFVPPAVNRLHRLIGGVAALAPLDVSLPAHVSLPARPGSDQSLDVRVTGLTVQRDGVELVVRAHL